ncbi:MAG TPA: endonuclease/exonuclease/phosphatase family protein [Acetobacteraceae bacterium]|nr:endonuclease/exonuclease/phosphatase family protein [Acetobacteraceae bacterium]
MAVLLFWNVRGSHIADSLASICQDHEVDVLMLAELEANAIEMLGRLNSTKDAPYWELRSPVVSRVRCFTRYPIASITPLFDDGRVSIRNLSPPIGASVLIVAVHMPSKLQSDDQDQHYRIRRLRGDIEEAERQVGHRNTVVIGDLNANPFEDAMVAADGLHGVMDKRIAERPPRSVQGKDWSFFCNPMWSRMGDESKGPPGTHYYARGGLVSYFWNTFDQVLLRPELLRYYAEDSVAVISWIDGRDLLPANQTARDAPDHLPILVRLSIETERHDG